MRKINFSNRVSTLILAVVCFISGIVVCFEWMGHDKGQRIYSMLKRPDVVEKRVEVEVEVLKPIIVSDDATIQLMNQKYRDALLVISQANLTLDSYRAMEKEYHRVVLFAGKTLRSAENIAAEGSN